MYGDSILGGAGFVSLHCVQTGYAAHPVVIGVLSIG
jgi:hypothetical protein